MEIPAGPRSLTGNPGDRAVKAPSTQGRMPELDGLRGMAILLVFLFHYIAIVPGGSPGSLLYRIQSCFAMGWVGVDLFFVLSGFLIGGILLDARPSRRYFQTFYARRLFRIIPLYYLWIALYLIIAFVFHNARGLLAVGSERATVAPIYLLFLQNWTTNLHATLESAWLGHLWSLAVEEQFYLVMPLAVRFLPKRALVGGLFLAIAGAPVLRLVVFRLSHSHAAQYMLTPCRADALAMGVLLAVGWREDSWRARFFRYKKIIYGVTALLFACVVSLAVSSPSPYSYATAAWGFSCIDIFFALLLTIAVLVPEGPWAGVCRWPWLGELGRLSYCLYIVHQVVNLLCHELLLHATPNISTWKAVAVTALAGLVSFAVAKVSWILFEQPLLRRGQVFRYFPNVAISPAAPAVLSKGVS